MTVLRGGAQRCGLLAIAVGLTVAALAPALAMAADTDLGGPFADDFAGLSLGSLWRPEGPSVAPVVADGYARMQIGPGVVNTSQTWSKFQSQDSASSPAWGYGVYTMGFRLSRRPQEPGQEMWAGWALYAENASGQPEEINFGIDTACIDQCDDTTLLFESYRDGKNQELVVPTGVSLYDGQFHTGQVTYGPSSIVFTFDGTQKAAITDPSVIPTVKMQIIPGARVISGALTSPFAIDIDRMTYSVS